MTDSVQTNDLKPGYEQVFTVTDYYDGPRKGIANYTRTDFNAECAEKRGT